MTVIKWIRDLSLDPWEVVRLKKRESDLLRKIGQLQVDNDFFASACEDAGLKVR